MNPIDFIAQSRFRHHIGLGKDYGYNKILQEWVKTDEKSSEYYSVPLEILERFSLNNNLTNRRPRDKNRGRKWNVFLQPDGKPSGNKNSTGNTPCFFMQIDAEDGYIFHQYWFFFGYNPSLVVIDLSHQGDWEDYTAVIKNGELVGAILNAHGKRTYYQKEQLEIEQGRVRVYCALGTHALYPQAGFFGKFGTDKTKFGGDVWDTSQNIELLSKQPWKDYAGAWGEVGELSATTGPLGPWYKLIPKNFFARSKT